MNHIHASAWSKQVFDLGLYSVYWHLFQIACIVKYGLTSHVYFWVKLAELLKTQSSYLIAHHGKSWSHQAICYKCRLSESHILSSAFELVGLDTFVHTLRYMYIPHPCIWSKQVFDLGLYWSGWNVFANGRKQLGVLGVQFSDVTRLPTTLKLTPLCLHCKV